MNPELKQSDYADSSTPVQGTDVLERDASAGLDIPQGNPAPIVRIESNTQQESTDQWREVGEKVSYYLAQLPELVSEFFGTYQRPLVTLGLLFAGIISVKLTLAILDAVNDIPLLAPTFELIGIAYSAWFVYRYMLKAETRRELSQEVETLKQQVVGSQK